MVTLPAMSKAVVAVRFCPVLFEKGRAEGAESEGDGEKPVFSIQHKIYFAVLTLDSVILYETDSMRPTALISGLHCASLTDVAWSPDGRRIAISSHDGYCSLVSFSSGELGKPLKVPAKKIAETKVKEGANQDLPSTPAPASAAKPSLEDQSLSAQAQSVEVVMDPNTSAIRKRIAPTPL